MKNFRKVLALVLVVATLLSFATMASAAEYVDQADINYEAAVDVLSAIGILNGYKTGDEYTFKPGEDIEREEMAKMIAVLHNAGYDIGDLYAEACPFADSKDSWAASYIAYCYHTGIVDGHDANTFAPNASITGYQVAKMLLVTLGFNAEAQGYVGKDWKVNVLRDAKNFGLLDGFAANYNIAAEITREEAALMMFNALQAPIVVGTLSDNLFTISNALVIEKLDLDDNDYAGNTRKPMMRPVISREWSLKDAQKYGWTVLYGNVVISDDLLSDMYKGLKVETNGVYDCFGRPGTKWSYTNANTGKVLFSKFYADTADYTFTTAVEFEKVLKTYVDAKGEYNYTFQYAWNGDPYKTVDEDDLATTLNGKTGKGVTTEIFVNNVTKKVTIVLINTYIGKVTAVKEFAGKFQISAASDWFDNVGDFKVGDYILFELCSGKGTHPAGYLADNVYGVSRAMHNPRLVTPVTVTVSDSFFGLNDTTLAKSTFTGDGKVYEYALNFDRWTAALNKSAANDYGSVTENNTKETLNVYLDDNGYVMLWTDYEAAVDKFVGYFIEDTMVREKDIVNEFINGNWVDVNVYHADVMDYTPALNEDVRLNTGAETATSLMGLANKIKAWENKAGVLAQYAINAKGIAYPTAYATFLPAGGKVETVTGKIYDDKGAVEVWGNNDTKYMIRTFDFATGEYVYDVVTGHKAIDTEYIAKVWMTSSSTDTYAEFASLQYLDLDNDNIAEYVFLDAAFTATSELIYVLEQTGWGSCADLIPDNVKHQIPGYAVYSALVGGKEATILAADHDLDVDADNALTKGLYKATAVALGAKDCNGNPVYVAFTNQPLSLTWYDVDKIFGGQLWINATEEERPEEEYKNIAADAQIVLLFQNAVDFDGDGVNDKYAVFNSVAEFNASKYNAVEFSCGGAWADADETVKADITQLFVEVTYVG